MMNDYAPAKENPLHLSWHDSAWIPILNPQNVLDYFSERSNPFYDRTCNNEVVKMQRLNPEQLQNMQGIEYILLHVQEPILYVIRKQLRHSPTQTTPLADYYILAGVVYQCPDLNSLLNSRIMSALHHLQSAFDEMNSYKNFHPSKGYSWDFSQGKDKDQESKDTSDSAAKKRAADPTRDDAGSRFQRRRVDFLLAELTKKFPPKIPTPDGAAGKQSEAEAGQNTNPSGPKAGGDQNQPPTTQAGQQSQTQASTAQQQSSQSQQTHQMNQQQQTPGTPGTPVTSIKSEKTEEKSNPPSNTSTSSSGSSSNATSTASNANATNNLGKLGPPEKKLKTS